VLVKANASECKEENELNTKLNNRVLKKEKAITLSCVVKMNGPFLLKGITKAHGVK